MLCCYNFVKRNKEPVLDREQEQSLKEVPLKEPQPAAQAEKKVLEEARSQTGLYELAHAQSVKQESGLEIPE